MTFHVSGRSFGVPGYIVWCALFYAGAASWLSWRVGRPLIQLNSERYAREADLRFALVRLNEHSDSVALYGGERDEKRRLTTELEKVLRVMRQIVSASTRLTCITAGYGWFTIIAPIVVASPRLCRPGDGRALGPSSQSRRMSESRPLRGNKLAGGRRLQLARLPSIRSFW